MGAHQDEERSQFCQRLQTCLQANGLATSATTFTAEFNLRATGKTVTVHGARKWLVGEAIPTQARLQVLADWLGVSAAWLRFGDAGRGVKDSQVPGDGTLLPGELCFVHQMRTLSAGNRLLLRNLLDAMLEGDIGRPFLS